MQVTTKINNKKINNNQDFWPWMSDACASKLLLDNANKSHIILCFRVILLGYYLCDRVRYPLNDVSVVCYMLCFDLSNRFTIELNL